MTSWDEKDIQQTFMDTNRRHFKIPRHSGETLAGRDTTGFMDGN